MIESKQNLDVTIGKILLNIGRIWAIIIFTLISIAASLLLTALFLRLQYGFMLPPMQWAPAAAIVPLIITPVTSTIVIFLTFRLIAAQSSLRHAASIDGLTGLFNRNTILEKGQILFTDKHHKLSILMIDIDHFKSINDKYGHAAGDMALITVASACRRSLRESDYLGRWGGEEFVAILKGCGESDAVTVAEFIRETIRETKMEIDQQVTVSIGISSTENLKCDDLSEVIADADKYLYLAKQNGRDRIHSAQIAARSIRHSGFAGTASSGKHP